MTLPESPGLCAYEKKRLENIKRNNPPSAELFYTHMRLMIPFPQATKLYC